MSAAEAKTFEGLLLRFSDDGHDLTLMIEPDDDGDAGALIGPVEEIICRNLVFADGGGHEFAKNLGAKIRLVAKLAGEHTVLEFYGDWFASIQGQCSVLASAKRDYNLEDLRQKVALLALAYQSIRQFSEDASQREDRLRARIDQFIEDRRTRWKARMVFFVDTHPEKATDFQAKLEVLQELESFLADDQRPAGP